MAEQPWPMSRRSHRLVFAYTSCLCLGLALAFWGLAPPFVERILTGRPPRWEAVTVASVTVLVGLTFIGLQQLIRRRVRWALWTAFVTALLLTTVAVAAMLLASDQRPSLFSLVLAGATTVATWLALTEQGVTVPAERE